MYWHTHLSGMGHRVIVEGWVHRREVAPERRILDDLLIRDNVKIKSLQRPDADGEKKTKLFLIRS